MREDVLTHFPKAPSLPKNIEKYLVQVDETYINDAYNSLSIEGYQVSPELIERVRSGDWDPNKHVTDRDARNALAARGYWQAFQSVKGSLKSILQGENAGIIADRDHEKWYRELFGPSVQTGILKASDLAGYRSNQVYIRRSQHVPPSKEAVREFMPAFFNLLSEEPEASVRIVLGHFFFVYIHPYRDGNGRIGRFLMNAMAASGG